LSATSNVGVGVGVGVGAGVQRWQLFNGMLLLQRCYCWCSKMICYCCKDVTAGVQRWYAIVAKMLLLVFKDGTR
jgi:hypothetical protein